MKVKLKVIIAIMLLNSCVQKEKSDIPENISAKMRNNKEIRLYNYQKIIELTGVFCDFFENFEDNKKSYLELMDKLDNKNWKFEFIFLEYESCWNNSMQVEFVKLNKEVFGNKLKSVILEEELVVIKLGE